MRNRKRPAIAHDVEKCFTGMTSNVPGAKIRSGEAGSPRTVKNYIKNSVIVSVRKNGFGLRNTP